MESESLGKRKQIYIFFLSTGSSHSITHTPYFFFYQRHIFYKISRTISYSSGSAISFRYGRDDIISSFSNLVTAHILQQIRGFSSLCRTFTAHITFLALYCSMLSICCSISFLHCSIFISLWLGIFNLLLTA